MEFKLAYSISEACEAASVRRTTLYEAIKNNRLRAVKRGARTLILTDDLQAWINQFPSKNDAHTASNCLAAQAGESNGSEEQLSIEEWLNIRKAAASRIDPETAKVFWKWG